MAVVLYTVQSRTWTNRMNVEAKFILPGLVKMQQVLEHHFAACRQRLKSPLHVARRVTVCLDG